MRCPRRAIASMQTSYMGLTNQMPRPPKAKLYFSESGRELDAARAGHVAVRAVERRLDVGVDGGPVLGHPAHVEQRALHLLHRRDPRLGARRELALLQLRHDGRQVRRALDVLLEYLPTANLQSALSFSIARATDETMAYLGIQRRHDAVEELAREQRHDNHLLSVYVTAMPTEQLKVPFGRAAVTGSAAHTRRGPSSGSGREKSVPGAEG